VLSEINLLRYPICLLSNNNLQELLEESARRRESHILYQETMPDGRVRVWRVTPNTKHGYTTPFDKAVVVTILKLATDEGFPPPMIYKIGSLRRIARTMKLPGSGSNLARIKESLQRISATNIYTESFYLKGAREYWKEEQREIGGSFSLWNVFWRNNKLPNGEAADCIYLQLNVPFILSLHDFYVKPLDYDYWLSLPPLAQRLYELTGLKFYGLKDSSYINFDYPELCQAMPIKAQQHFSKAKQILERAHRKLVETGWLKRAEWRGSKAQRTLHPDALWVIHYHPGPRAHEELAQARERLRRFQQRARRHEELPLWVDVQAWVNELTQTLKDPVGQNRGYFTKIAKLITQEKLDQSLVWEGLSLAKSEDLEGRIKSTRSAFFTDYIKRQLREHGQDLNELLKQV